MRSGLQVILGFCLFLGLSAAADSASLSDLFGPVSGQGSVSKELLPPEKAFGVSAQRTGPQAFQLSFRMAPGYYLYREKFEVGIPEDPTFRFSLESLPHGEQHDDPEFGVVEIFRGDLELNLKMRSESLRDQEWTVVVKIQGCADRGVCYPPMERVFRLAATVQSSDSDSTVGVHEVTEPVSAGECAAQGPEGFIETEGLSEECGIAQRFERQGFSATLIGFLGMGVLLSLTPCVFPLVPILSGIIVGQGQSLTAGRGLVLSLVYVLSSALAYTLFGVLAALFGHNLQALLQEPWVLVGFSGIFVVLALGMFDVFQLAAPRALERWFHGLSRGAIGGSPLGVALMGVLSALIVGPCVAPPLAGALIYIGRTGDAWLGGAALFMLGFGMGLPLLLFGFSAGRWLPKAGPWMSVIKAIFGVGLLANALWLLSRIVPPHAMLGVWAVFAVAVAVYLGAFDPVAGQGGWMRLRKALAVSLLTYGLLMLAGFARGGQDPFMPLRDFASALPSGHLANAPLAFERVAHRDALEQALAQAKAEGRPALIDFYADWCVACKEMDQETFGDSRVRVALQHWRLIRVDITQNSAEDRRLLERYHLIGPPAVILQGPEGQERRSLRVIGFMAPDAFLKVLQRL